MELVDNTKEKDTAVKASSHARPSEAQLRYLVRGLEQPGGKLPLFDADGQRINAQTIRACMDHGWCEPWYANPVKPDWLVCRLTEAGRMLLQKHNQTG